VPHTTRTAISGVCLPLGPLRSLASLWLTWLLPLNLARVDGEVACVTQNKTPLRLVRLEGTGKGKSDCTGLARVATALGDSVDGKGRQLTSEVEGGKCMGHCRMGRKVL